MSGGYSGTSEAVSFGASRVPQSKIEGILCSSAYPNRVPNQYISITTSTNDIFHRQQTFVAQTDAFVVMPGTIGTLNKLISLWHLSTIEESQSKTPLCMITWSQPWLEIIQQLSKPLNIPQQLIESIKFVESVDQIMTELEKMKQQKKANKGNTSAASSSSSSASN